MKANVENFAKLGSDHKHNYPEGGAGGEQSRPVLPGKNRVPPKGVQRMWPGGPLRQFSKKPLSSHYAACSGPFLTGYAGSYVCDRCLSPCAGVYYAQTRQEWLCGTCRKPGALEGQKGFSHGQKSESRLA